MSSGAVELIISAFPKYGAEASAFLTGLLAGYPSGAVIVEGLHEKGTITKKRGEYILTFSNNTSLSFLFGFVALVVGKQGAFVLLLCQILFSMIFATVGRFFLSNEDKAVIPPFFEEAVPFSKAVIGSIKKATGNMINVCGIIIFFSAFSTALLYDFPILSGFTELIKGIASLKTLPFDNRLFWASSFIGFGGLCIGFQISSVCSVGLKKYAFSRIISAFLFPFVTKIMYNVIF
jgi:hypothetical protein